MNIFTVPVKKDLKIFCHDISSFHNHLTEVDTSGLTPGVSDRFDNPGLQGSISARHSLTDRNTPVRYGNSQDFFQPAEYF
jgi:hypothetical protein